MPRHSSPPAHQSRDAVSDIWGPRHPYKGQWDSRVDSAWDEEPESWVQSACVLCSNGCGLDIGVKNGKVVGVRGRENDRVSRGRLGPKGLLGWKAIHHPDRLQYPMIRKNGELQRASWDEAMELIVSKSKQHAEELTRHSIAFYTSGQLFLEEYYALAMVGKAGLNTLHMDGNTRLCTATAAASMRESFGSDGQPGSYKDIDVTDCLFMVGHNMAATQTVLWSRVLDRLEGPDPPKLVVVDPRLSDTARKATVHLAPKSGTNLALLNGIQRLLIKNGWVDRSYIEAHTIGFAELENILEKYDPKEVEKVTGVPASDLEKAARIIGEAPRLLSTVLQGVYQSNQATASACQVNNINLLRGKIGQPGSGVLQMNGQPTAQNNREAGCDGEFPGFRNHQNPAHMEELARLWNINTEQVPHWNEPTHIETMLSHIDQGSIAMLWVSGTNPLVSLPNLPRMRDLFTRPLLFLVVQDIYMTETAKVADVVLPAAQWGEKTGCFTNVDRTVHISHKAVEPPGEAKSDLEIFLDYARRMDFRDRDQKPLMPWTKSEEVFEAWKKLSEGRPCDYTGMTYEKLTGSPGIQWPCNRHNPEGTERLFGDGQFYTDIEHCESYGHDLETGAPLTKDEYRAMSPKGRAILKACHFLPSTEEPDDEYPLRITTGRKAHHFHTRTKTGRTPLQAACPEPEAAISRRDAETRGIEDGEMIIVRSRRGAVEIKAKIGGVRQGEVFIPFHFGYWDGAKGGRATAANELTIEQWDPVSKQPRFKSGAVRLEKLPPQSKDKNAVQVPEQQSAAVKRASVKKPEATSDVTSSRHRERMLELWLGEVLEATVELRDLLERLLPSMLHDLEIHAGLLNLGRLAETAADTLSDQESRYEHQDRGIFNFERHPGEARSRGRRRADQLSGSLFGREAEDEQEDDHGLYKVLKLLQNLHVYIANIQAGITALVPTSQALWDAEFIKAVEIVEGTMARMQSWVLQQIRVRSPQALIVPTLPNSSNSDD